MAATLGGIGRARARRPQGQSEEAEAAAGAGFVSVLVAGFDSVFVSVPDEEVSEDVVEERLSVR